MIYKKIYTWSIFLTAFVSFGIWHLVNSINISGIDGNLQIIVNFVVGAFSSYGFFIGIVSLFGWFIEKSKCIKKRFFASSYIEGVWIGFAIPNENEIVLVVQQIKQTSSEISVYGERFRYVDGNPIFHGSLVSTSASFDNNKHSLNCTYMSNKVDEVNAGFLSYQFINRGKKSPDVFLGFITNYTIKGKIVLMCKRHYDLEDIPDLKTILNDAKIFYENQKEYFDYHEKT
jgi:hypothetical protein